MMKKRLNTKLSLATFSFMLTPLVSTSALAHSGHLSNDSVHGMLHIEHIVALLAIGLAVYLIKEFRGK